MRLLVDFGNSVYPSGTPDFNSNHWNNLTTHSVQDYGTLVDTDNNATSIGIEITQVGHNNYGNAPYGVNQNGGTNSNTTKYPGSAWRDSFFLWTGGAGNDGIMRIYGLSPSATYTFFFTGSRAATGWRRMELSDNAGATYRNPAKGTNTDNFYDAGQSDGDYQSDDNGIEATVTGVSEITFTMAVGAASTFGYFGILDINESGGSNDVTITPEPGELTFDAPNPNITTPTSELGILYSQDPFQHDNWNRLGNFGTEQADGVTLSGGTASFTTNLAEFELPSNKHNYTMLEKWKMRLWFNSGTLNGTSYGMGMGIKSSHRAAGERINTICRIAQQSDGDQGKVYFYDSSGFGDQQTYGTQTALSSNTDYIMEVERDGYTLTGRILNAAGDTVLIEESHTYNLASTNTFWMHNTGKFCIWNFGGSQKLTRIEISSTVEKGRDILFIGDSNMFGLYQGATISDRWVNEAMANHPGQSFVVIAGQGDETGEVLSRIDEILELNPSRVLISLLSNDVANGVASGTYEANFNSIISQLEGAGIEVFVTTPIARDGVTMTTANAYINGLSNQSSDFWTLTQTGGGNLNNTYDSGDNIHINGAGAAAIEAKIRQDLPSLFDPAYVASGRILIDVGDTSAGFITTSPDSNGKTWNNSPNLQRVQDHGALLYDDGFSSGLDWECIAQGDNSFGDDSGTNTTGPNSGTANYPASAWRDSYFTESGDASGMQLRFNNLDPAKDYVFFFTGARAAASPRRVDCSDDAGATYRNPAKNGGVNTNNYFDAGNNDADYQSESNGIEASLSGVSSVTFTFSSGGGGQFGYVGIIEITETSSGTDVTITPETTDLVFDSQNPAVTTSTRIDVTITPETTELTFDSQDPAVSTGSLVILGGGTLTLDSQNPTITTSTGSQNETITPEAGELVFDSPNPVVNAQQNVVISPETTDLTFDSPNPAVTTSNQVNEVITPETTDLVLDAPQPLVTTTQNQVATPETTDLVFDSPNPTVTVNGVKLFHIVVMGQSQARGFQATPALTTASVPNCWTLTDGPLDVNTSGVLVPLLESGVETIATALAQQLNDFVNIPNHQFAVTIHAVGGTTIEQLSKGGSTGKFEEAIASAETISDIALANGWEYEVHLVWMHGGTGNNTPTPYGDQFADLVNEFRTDVTPHLHSQAAGNVHVFAAQQRQIGSPDYSIQLYEQSELLSNVHISHPRYTLEYQGDNIHLTNHGTRNAGVLFARAIYTELFSGGWRPLAIGTVTFDGIDTFTIPFMDGVGVLVGNGNLGVDLYNVSDGQSEAYTGGVVGQSLQLTLTNPHVSGAKNYEIRVQQGITGNIRDSSTEVFSFDDAGSNPYDPYKYAVRETKAITATIGGVNISPEPGELVFDSPNPTINTGQSVVITPEGGELALVAPNPTINTSTRIDVVITPEAGELTFDSPNPVVDTGTSLGVIITPPTTELALDSQNPNVTLTANIIITPAPGELILFAADPVTSAGTPLDDPIILYSPIRRTVVISLEFLNTNTMDLYVNDVGREILLEVEEDHSGEATKEIFLEQYNGTRVVLTATTTEIDGKYYFRAVTADGQITFPGPCKFMSHVATPGILDAVGDEVPFLIKERI